MSTEMLFILSLHLLAAIITAAMAARDGLGPQECVRWGGIGFITGVIGLITRSRMDRRHVHYVHMVQDTILNLGLEAVGLYGLPHLMH